MLETRSNKTRGEEGSQLPGMGGWLGSEEGLGWIMIRDEEKNVGGRNVHFMADILQNTISPQKTVAIQRILELVHALSVTMTVLGNRKSVTVNDCHSISFS